MKRPVPIRRVTKARKLPSNSNRLKKTGSGLTKRGRTVSTPTKPGASSVTNKTRGRSVATPVKPGVNPIPKPTRSRSTNRQRSAWKKR